MTCRPAMLADRGSREAQKERAVQHYLEQRPLPRGDDQGSGLPLEGGCSSIGSAS